VNGSMEGEEIYAVQKAPAPASSAIERRIRARARARSGGKKMQLEGRKQKAKKLKDEGNYEAAAAEYREAIEESKQLDQLEDEESVEYDFAAEELMGELQEVEARSEANSDDAKSEANVEGAVEDVVDEAGEKDMVSAWAAGLWRVIGGGDEEPVVVAVGVAVGVAADGVAPWTGGPLVEVPGVGEVVRYQHLLLEAGERRTVPVDAKRRLGR
jgi:hypothetical protein